MAITHADLTNRKHQYFWGSDIGSRLALFLVLLSVLCGLVSFVLCLAAEASRSEATWYSVSTQGRDGGKTDVCMYESSGRAVLACAVCAFLLLAVAVLAEHAYMLLAVASPKHSNALDTNFAPPRPLLPEDPLAVSSTARSLTGQACFLFLAAWICFGIAEVLLIIGIGVESGHISQWSKPKLDCHVIRPGLFAAAGIFGLIAVLLGVALYVTALHSERRLLQEEDTLRRRSSAPPPPPPTQPHTFPRPSAPQAHDQSQPRGEPAALEKTSASA